MSASPVIASAPRPLSREDCRNVFTGPASWRARFLEDFGEAERVSGALIDTQTYNFSLDAPVAAFSPVDRAASAAAVALAESDVVEGLSIRDRASIQTLIYLLRNKYGKRGARPERWVDIPQSVLDSLGELDRRYCEALVAEGLERLAIRAAYCGRLGFLWECRDDLLKYKMRAYCNGRTHPPCAEKNFDKLFRSLLPLDESIPAAVRALPGWGWNVFDCSFRHDRAKDPTHEEMVGMVKVIGNTVRCAVREAKPDWWRAGQGCRPKLDSSGAPIHSSDGWPIGIARDGSERRLLGWETVYLPEHFSPDNKARKQGLRGAKKMIPARWVLRFGFEFVRVTEFGLDNTNAHFHGAYFGPPLDYGYDERRLKETGSLNCWGRLVDIFKEESKRVLGRESYTVFYAEASQGFRSVLAHALKYTKKLPRTTPEGLAHLAKVLAGTRRVAVLGAHYGVPLSKPSKPKCSRCGGPLERVHGLGLVPMEEVAYLPDVTEEKIFIPSEAETESDPAEFLKQAEWEGAP